jgi:hypothetical protein
MNTKSLAPWKSAATALFALVLAGCASMPAAYVPTQLGPLTDADSTNDLVMVLKPDRNVAKIGDLITFDITLKNKGKQTIWVPAKPEIILAWIYPDGRCDNFLGDPSAQSAAPAMAPLAPGAVRQFETTVATHYFERLGITEFRARISVPELAANAPGPCWCGDIDSNGYGVMFAR